MPDSTEDSTEDATRTTTEKLTNWISTENAENDNVCRIERIERENDKTENDKSRENDKARLTDDSKSEEPYPARLTENDKLKSEDSYSSNSRTTSFSIEIEAENSEETGRRASFTPCMDQLDNLIADTKLGKQLRAICFANGLSALQDIRSSAAGVADQSEVIDSLLRRERTKFLPGSEKTESNSSGKWKSSETEDRKNDYINNIYPYIHLFWTYRTGSMKDDDFTFLNIADENNTDPAYHHRQLEMKKTRKANLLMDDIIDPKSETRKLLRGDGFSARRTSGHTGHYKNWGPADNLKCESGQNKTQIQNGHKKTLNGGNNLNGAELAIMKGEMPQPFLACYLTTKADRNRLNLDTLNLDTSKENLIGSWNENIGSSNESNVVIPIVGAPLNETKIGIEVTRSRDGDRSPFVWLANRYPSKGESGIKHNRLTGVTELLHTAKLCDCTAHPPDAAQLPDCNIIIQPPDAAQLPDCNTQPPDAAQLPDCNIQPPDAAQLPDCTSQHRDATRFRESDSNCTVQPLDTTQLCDCTSQPPDAVQLLDTTQPNNRTSIGTKSANLNCSSRLSANCSSRMSVTVPSDLSKSHIPGSNSSAETPEAAARKDTFGRRNRDKKSVRFWELVSKSYTRYVAESQRLIHDKTLLLGLVTVRVDEKNSGFFSSTTFCDFELPAILRRVALREKAEKKKITVKVAILATMANYFDFLQWVSGPSTDILLPNTHSNRNTKRISKKRSLSDKDIIDSRLSEMIKKSRHYIKSAHEVLKMCKREKLANDIMRSPRKNRNFLSFLLPRIGLKIWTLVKKLKERRNFQNLHNM